LIFRDACLCLLVVLSLGAGTAAAQGFSVQQSLGMTSSFNQTLNNDYLGLFGPGLNVDISFPWFDWELNESYDLGDMYSYYSEYYVSGSLPVVGGIISTPVKFDINRGTPTKIYLGSGQQVAYSQYTTSVSSARGNELWIQGPSEWSSYVVCPAGTGLQLVAFSPAGGPADFFEIIQTNTVNATAKRYQFYSGYNSMNFVADQIGRHILMFVVNNQPSSVVIVDVISPAPPVVQSQPIATQAAMTGTVVNAGSSQTQTTGGSFQYSQYSSQYTSTQVPTSQYTSPSTPTSVPSGDTPVTIQTSILGYDVYLDGAYIGKEGTGGDSMDGVFKFKVVGGQTHTIRIFDGMNPYERTMYFERGVQKIINVPPATTVIVSGGLI
jgi:hypothetical protein